MVRNGNRHLEDAVTILIDNTQPEPNKNCVLSSSTASPQSTPYPDSSFSRRAGLIAPYRSADLGVPAQADIQGEPANPSTPSQAALYPDTLPIMISGVQPADPGCGEVVAMKVCENQDHPARVVRHSCGRSGCVTCWPVWAKRAASRAADRLRGYHDATRNVYDPWHLTLSPPAGLPESQESMRTLYSLARDQAKILGVSAAVVVIHGYRIRKKYHNLALKKGKESGLNRYRWCLSQPDPRKYLYWSPHFHLLGWGFLMDSDAFYKATGWIYNKHKNRSLDHMNGTMHYLLSHAWQFGPGTNSYRYWQGLAPTKMTVQETVTWEIEHCKVCSKPLRRVPITVPLTDGTRNLVYQDVKNAPVSKVKVVHRTYWIKKKRRATQIHSSPQISTWLDEDQEEEEVSGAGPGVRGGHWPPAREPSAPAGPHPPPDDGPYSQAGGT